MMHQKILLDTGPLVAFLNRKDRYHKWAIAQFGSMSTPLLTCEAVVSESCFLMRNCENGTKHVMSLLERELITIPFHLEDELRDIKKSLDKYKDIPMSLADGCLVRMAEQIADSVIFTLDRDFKIYRKSRRSVIPIIIPDDI